MYVSKETFDQLQGPFGLKKYNNIGTFNKLLDQSVPLVTVRSIVSLLTEQL